MGLIISQISVSSDVKHTKHYLLFLQYSLRINSIT